MPEGVAGGCVPISKPEGNAIETQQEMLERAARTTAPFDTVAPGAYGAAVSSASKAAHSAGSWKQLGPAPLRADNPDYAGSDAAFASEPEPARLAQAFRARDRHRIRPGAPGSDLCLDRRRRDLGVDERRRLLALDR